MTTKYSLGYSGRCVGGPYDGQAMANYSQRMVVMKSSPLRVVSGDFGALVSALEPAAELGAYEWNDKYKAWDWVAYAIATQESA